MRAGGIGAVRAPLCWSGVQPQPDAAYDWHSFDRLVRIAAHHRLRVLPFLCDPPRWAVPTASAFPLRDRGERRGWLRFVRAAVNRYGPHGGFWRRRAGPYLPIRSWQVWNEANFYYFARPISPRLYGRLFVLTARTIRRTRPRSRVVLSGLFGRPNVPRRRGMPAVRFLAALYRVPGLRRVVGGVALHPYAARASQVRRLVIGIRAVTRRHRDGAVPLFITEMGWGSQPDPRRVAFEKGLRGQARELRAAYRFLTRNRRRLGIRAAYWFSWKDVAGACSFCDSAGLFYGGAGFAPKPAWYALLHFTGGKAAP